MAYMLLPGASGDYARLPDAAVLDESGVLDVRAEVDLDAYSGGITQHLITRWTAGSDRLWQFYLVDKRGTFTFRNSVGTFDTPQADADFTVTSGTPVQFRCVVDAPNQTATYYQRAIGTALTDDSGWTQVGSVIATTNTDIRTGSAVAAFGASDNGTVGRATGKYFRGVVKKGAGGTLIVDADPSDPNTWTSDTTFTENANSATVTLQGDAELVGVVPLVHRGAPLMLGI